MRILGTEVARNRLFFAGRRPTVFHSLKTLAYLIDHLLFEQASVLQREIHLTQSFYQEIVRGQSVYSRTRSDFSIPLT